MTTAASSSNGHRAWMRNAVFALIGYGIALGTYLVPNQVLDNAFRGEGDRFTASDAERQTRIIVAEVVDQVELLIQDHEDQSGHREMQVRMKNVEAKIEATLLVEEEETEILRDMRDSIKQYVEHRLRERIGNDS